MTEQEWLGNNQLSLDIWYKKYQADKESFDQWIDRVSGGDEDIKALIKDRKFLFGGRILAGRGILANKQTLSNCYVLPMPEDNLESIFEVAKMMARTYSTGGGSGVNVSKLRPKDTIVHNAARSTTGPTSFMELYSFVTGLIGQNNRRGALMLSIDCHHPDIEEFINLKSKPGICEKANISVMITDDFMRAVKEDKEWTTVFDSKETGRITRTFKARELLKLLAKRNWEWAEPGVLYWDRITSYNMNDNNPEFKLAGTNPCGEIPLQEGGACLLGSLNLSEFVLNPFTKTAEVDHEGLEEAVAYAVRGLNAALDENISTHPLEIQRTTSRDWRPIGLGTMGLADMLIKLGVTYGSPKALAIVEEVYKTIARSAVYASLFLARQYGCFPKCDKAKIAESSFIKSLNLPDNYMEGIRQYGLYNSQLLTCAPTGSIATMLQVSTGIEPNFALHYTRKTQSLHGKDTFYEVDAQIVEEYKNNRTLTLNDKLPSYFVESKDIDSIDRVKMQAVIQKYVDNSISSTINLPKEATVDEVFDIYLAAWEHGLKGVTIYRSGCNREGILTVQKPEDIQETSAPKRPVSLPCDIHKVKVGGENFIVCVGLYNDTPYEIFVFRLANNITLTASKGTITKKSKGIYSLVSNDLKVDNLLNTDISMEEKAATLYSSMLLRHGVTIRYIIKTARKVNDNITSFSSAMCRVLGKYVPDRKEGKCPECGRELIHSGGCIHCESCGYSKCE